MFGHDNTDDSTTQTIIPDQDDDQSLVDQSVEQMPEDEINLPNPDVQTTNDVAPTEEYIATPIGIQLPSDTPKMQTAPVAATDYSPAPIGIAPNGTMSNLSALRQEALRELSPLIGQLDQTPDEKYATAKMVYEETNDQNILSAVYEAAKNLTNEKAKAEAIYDIIKKINAANL